MADKRPGSEAKVCFNCEHLLWLADLGHGLKCKHKDNETPDGEFLSVPAVDHTCPLFQEHTGTRDRGWCGY